jgi:hypothetical protein
MEEKQRRANELHEEKMRQLRAELSEDKKRLEDSMRNGHDPNKIPVETICKATAMTVAMTLLRRGGILFGYDRIPLAIESKLLFCFVNS